MGIAIVLFSGDWLSVSRQIGRAQAEGGRRRSSGLMYQRLLDSNVETGPKISIWLGRAVGAAAIVVGVVLLIID